MWLLFCILFYFNAKLNFLLAWEGHFCSEDVDGCREIGCFEGMICFDIPAPEVGVICGPCPEGFLGDGRKCYGMCIAHLSTNICTAFKLVVV